MTKRLTHKNGFILMYTFLAYLLRTHLNKNTYRTVIVYILQLLNQSHMRIWYSLVHYTDFLGGSDGKASGCHAGDPGSIPGSGRSPGEGNGSSLQYSCLENSMDWGAWWATVRGVAKTQTRLSDFTFFHFSTLYSQLFMTMNSQMILKVKQILNPLLTIFFL